MHSTRTAMPGAVTGSDNCSKQLSADSWSWAARAEFTGALCKEQWHMVDGRLQVEGQSEAAANAEKLEWKRQEEMTDALGNVVRILPILPYLPWCVWCALRHFRA